MTGVGSDRSGSPTGFGGLVRKSAWLTCSRGSGCEFWIPKASQLGTSSLLGAWGGAKGTRRYSFPGEDLAENINFRTSENNQEDGTKKSTDYKGVFSPHSDLESPRP